MSLYHLWLIVFQIFHIFHLTCSKSYRRQNKEFQIQRHSQFSLELAIVLNVCAMSFGEYISKYPRLGSITTWGQHCHLHKTIWRYNRLIYHWGYSSCIYICLIFLFVLTLGWPLKIIVFFISLIYIITWGIQVSSLIFSNKRAHNLHRLLIFLTSPWTTPVLLRYKSVTCKYWSPFCKIQQQSDKQGLSLT